MESRYPRAVPRRGRGLAVSESRSGPLLPSHKFQSHGTGQARRRGYTESICMILKPFYSEKLSNSSDLMKGKSNHVDDANFSSPLPAIIFSCKIRMERKRCNEEENDTTDT